MIAAEDTRHTQHLLARYGIRATLTSYFEGNETEKAEVLVQRLHGGQTVALVCDAGTPGISDPGYRLVTRCAAEGISVSPIPGPTAAIAALSISGLPTDAFSFVGFLPPKGAARRRRLEALREDRRTLILYEAPFRLHRTLRELLEVLGDRQIVMARELTKVFEEVRRGRISQVLRDAEGRRPKGEYTLVIEGKRAGKRSLVV